MQRYLALTGLALVALAIGSVAPAHAGCVVPVPEIDPSVAQSALTLLVGGVLVLLGRRRQHA
jgi:hypothetical protein